MSYTFIFAIYVIIGFGIYVTCVYRAELDNEPLDENACAELASSCIMWPLFLLIIPIGIICIPHFCAVYLAKYHKSKLKARKNNEQIIKELQDKIDSLTKQKDE